MALIRRQLARRRKAVGYSQESFAAALGVDRSTVARWERGETEPQPHFRPKLAELLEVTTAELEALLSPLHHDNVSPTVVLSDERTPSASLVMSQIYFDASDVDDMNRREFLQILSITGALAALPPGEGVAAAGSHTGSLSMADLDRYEQLNTHLWQAFSMARSKTATYPLVRDQLGALVEGFDRVQGEDAHRRLCMLSADLFQLIGEVFFDSNRYTDAAHCYHLAASAAREVRAHDLWACALTRHAFISLHERRFGKAVSVLNAATAVARRGDGQLSTRHWVAAVQAEAFAGLGDLDSCGRALELAGQVHEVGGEVHNGGWLRFDGSRLAEERGTCFVRLGRPDLAEEALGEALAQQLSPRRRGSVLTDLAILGVQRQDTDLLLTHAEEALDLAQTSGSGYMSHKLRELHEHLEPFKADRRISALSSRIAGLPTTAS